VMDRCTLRPCFVISGPRDKKKGWPTRVGGRISATRTNAARNSGLGEQMEVKRAPCNSNCRQSPHPRNVDRGRVSRPFRPVGQDSSAYHVIAEELAHRR
jgi:hypothetical protein